jgi:hypothetical protein
MVSAVVWMNEELLLLLHKQHNCFSPLTSSSCAMSSSFLPLAASCALNLERYLQHSEEGQGQGSDRLADGRQVRARARSSDNSSPILAVAPLLFSKTL